MAVHHQELGVTIFWLLVVEMVLRVDPEAIMVVVVQHHLGQDILKLAVMVVLMILLEMQIVLVHILVQVVVVVVLILAVAQVLLVVQVLVVP